MDFLKSAAGTRAGIKKLAVADVMATDTEATAKNAVLAASTAVDRPVKAKVAGDTQGRSAAWVVAKVAVPVGAAKAGVPVVADACSVRAT